MKTHWSGLLILSLLVTLPGAWNVAAGQEPSAGSKVAVLDMPHALRLEHKYLQEGVARALADRGSVGDAARAIDTVLRPHLEREAALALRPLGLLRGLARDAKPADISAAVAMTVKIEQELPGLLADHRAIADASKRLMDVARRERKPEFVDLADRLWLHARIAEEVLYPAAIVLGEYLSITRAGKPGTPPGAKH